MQEMKCNFIEFVSDHYAAFSINKHFNGFFFNKILMLKKLKLLEGASAKILYGGVRNENNSGINFSTFKFSAEKENNLTSTYILNKTHSIEVSAGIMNIFKIIRMDLVKRLTYLDRPEVTQWSIRTKIKIDF